MPPACSPVTIDLVDEGGWLPDIAIEISEPCDRFLDLMAEAARAAGWFNVERHTDALERFGVNGASFQWCGPSAHADLSFQLIGRPDVPLRVEVEVRAQRWNEDPLTAATYVTAARMLVRPLLLALNRMDGGTLRLQVERRRKDFRLTERSRRLLDRFALLANPRALHPLDWRRFYDLVSQGRQEIPAGVLRTQLRKAGFSREGADELASLYEHLRAFKRHR